MRKTNLLIGISALLVLGQAAGAAVVYTDATSGPSGNTTLANGATFTPPLNGTTGNDNNWEQRTVFGSSGTVYEAGGEAAGEDAPTLRTTISGLTAGSQYQVYAFFWDPTSNVEDWNLRAGFSADNLTLYSNPDATTDAALVGAVGAPLASTLTYSTSPTVFLEGNRDLRAAGLGVATADVNGQIAIYADNLTGAPNVNFRTWYDGVGADLVVPEPASLASLAVLASMGIRRRRGR